MYAPMFEDDGDLAVIGPVDSRVQEIDTTRFPWNTIVHLCRDFGDGACRGCSGILIGRRLALTAAHCLWNIARAAAPRRIMVMPGRRDRLTKPYGAIESREYWIPRGFIEGPDRQSWDWGVLRLSRDVPAGINRFATPRAFLGRGVPPPDRDFASHHRRLSIGSTCGDDVAASGAHRPFQSASALAHRRHLSWP